MYVRSLLELEIRLALLFANFEFAELTENNIRGFRNMH